MNRLDTEGALHYHGILFLVFAIIFISLKNLNFTDYKSSPYFSETQVLFLQVVFIALFFWILLISLRGFSIKTPEYATRGALSLVLVALGLFTIFLNFIWDDWINGTETTIGGLGAVSIAVSSMIIAAGMVVYIFIKFSENRQRQWFIDAVKDTMERIEVAEYRPRARRYRTAGISAGGRRLKVAKKVKSREFREITPVKSPMPQPETQPIQSAPSLPSPRAAPIPAPVPQTQKVIKCPGCSVPLKIPDVPTRPLSIRCPHCGSIGTIYE